MTWTFDRARDLIIKLESRLPDAGCHIALTGGVLYKQGHRKDLDLVIYRIRQMKINEKLLKKIFEDCGIEIIKQFGWMYKAKYMGRGIDILIPESEGTEAYPSPQDEWVHNLIHNDI